MTAKLSWELHDRGVLRLTITDGPKVTHYTLRKTHSPGTQRAILLDVLEDLGGPVLAPSIQPVSVAPVAFVDPFTGAPVYDRPSVEERLEQQSEPEQQPMSEEESLELLKRRAWEMAQKNLGFHRGELPDDTAAMLSRMPAHEKFGQNPGLPALDGTSGGVTAVDGTYIDPSQFRAKPRYNVENHED